MTLAGSPFRAAGGLLPALLAARKTLLNSDAAAGYHR
jgi:hypothetical protein